MCHIPLIYSISSVEEPSPVCTVDPYTQRASTFLAQLDIQQATTCGMSTNCTGLTIPPFTVKHLPSPELEGAVKTLSEKHSQDQSVNTVQ